MAFNGKFLQPLLVLGVLIVLMILEAAAASKPNSRCHRRCGRVEIPYPFGTSEGCYLDSTFLITCNNTLHPPKPSLGSDMFVEDISVLDGEMRVSNPVASLCKVLDRKSRNNRKAEQCSAGDPNKICSTSGVRHPSKSAIPCSAGNTVYSRCISNGREPISISVNYSGNSALIKLPNFRISNKRNKITAVGCGVYSFIQGFVEQKGFTTGCLSLCNSNASDVVNGSCSGIGCCQTSIPNGPTEFDLSVRSLSEYNTKTLDIGECAYGFIVDEKAYNFSSSDFSDLLYRKTVPLVLDWAVRQTIVTVTIPATALGIVAIASMVIKGTHTSLVDLIVAEISTSAFRFRNLALVMQHATTRMEITHVLVYMGSKEMGGCHPE